MFQRSYPEADRVSPGCSLIERLTSFTQDGAHLIHTYRVKFHASARFHETPLHRERKEVLVAGQNDPASSDESLETLLEILGGYLRWLYHDWMTGAETGESRALVDRQLTLLSAMSRLQWKVMVSMSSTLFRGCHTAHLPPFTLHRRPSKESVKNHHGAAKNP